MFGRSFGIASIIVTLHPNEENTSANKAPTKISITEEKQSTGLTLNLGAVEPMVMLPCGDRNDQKKAGIVPKASKAGMELNAGQIGGYTGGTIEQLRKAASMLDGHKLALGSV